MGKWAFLTHFLGCFYHQRQTFDPAIPNINVSYPALSLAALFLSSHKEVIHPLISSVNQQTPIILFCPISMG